MSNKTYWSLLTFFILIVLLGQSCGGGSTSNQKINSYSFEDTVSNRRAEWKRACDVRDSLKGPDVKRVFYNADNIIRKLENEKIVFGFAERIYSHNSAETKDHTKDLHKYRIVSKDEAVKVEIEYDSDTRELLDANFTLNTGEDLDEETFDDMKSFVVEIANIFDKRAGSFYANKLDNTYFQKPDGNSDFDGDFDLPDKNIAFEVLKDTQRDHHEKTISLSVGWIIHHPNHYYDML